MSLVGEAVQFLVGRVIAPGHVDDIALDLYYQVIFCKQTDHILKLFDGLIRWNLMYPHT